MKMRLSIVCAGALIAPMLFAQSALAQFTEIGDAPETIAGAQPVGTSPGAITSLTGTLSSGTDADLFTIFIVNPAAFSATTVNAVTGADTQLFLFRLDGTPIYMNDNAPGGLSLGSQLPAGNSLRPTTQGYYILGISVAGYNPVNILNQPLFADDPTTTAVRGQNVNNGNRPLDHWASDFVDTGGGYRIDFTGTTVPEPTTWALLAFGTILVGGVARRKRRTAKSTIE